MKKKEENAVVPIYEVHPIAKAEEGDENNLDAAIKMARKWVEENKL